MANSERSHKSPLSFRHMEEKQWARRVREEEDRQAFENIFRRYYKRLHGFAYSYVGQVQEAEDIVQSVFLKIWMKRESWNPPGTVKNYIFAAVRNESLNNIRHDQLVEETEEEVARRFRELKDPTPSDSEIDSEVEALREAIQTGIDQLPSQCRQVFLLSRRGGLTYSEIADMLDISVNTVGTQMGRALKSLRNHLSDYIYLFAAAELSTMVFQTILFLILVFTIILI